MYMNKKNGNTRTIRYIFQTKDDVEYRILLFIWTLNKMGRLDFETIGKKNPEHTSGIRLINTYDSIKVFNTLKYIINLHKNEIEKLIISSIPKRVVFYKKLLDYLHIDNKNEIINGQKYLVAYLNKNME